MTNKNNKKIMNKRRSPREQERRGSLNPSFYGCSVARRGGEALRARAGEGERKGTQKPKRRQDRRKVEIYQARQMAQVEMAKSE